MLMSKNVNNDVSKDSPIALQMLCTAFQKETNRVKHNFIPGDN